MLNHIVRSLAFAGLAVGLVGLATMGTGLSQISNQIGRMLMIPGVAGFSVIAAIGAYVAYKTGQVEKKLKRERREQAVLKALRSRGGRITPMELASEVGLSLTVAGKELDRLIEEGHGHSDLTEDMRKIYVFPAFDAPVEAAPPPPPPVAEAPPRRMDVPGETRREEDEGA